VVVASGITVFCSDLEAARDFYGERLGMELSEDEDGFWARREALELRVEPGARRRRLSRAFYQEAGLMVRVEVDDFDAFVGGIVGKGVQLFGQVKDSDAGRFAGFCDPDGNLFELIETLPGPA
jgi:catechol 2,3-dioxygenase-like lactoylglutathione lyase family enzyme